MSNIFCIEVLTNKPIYSTITTYLLISHVTLMVLIPAKGNGLGIEVMLAL